jgi:hypothetical protein
MGERSVYRFVVGKPEGKRPLGSPRRRWRIILKWIFRIWEWVMEWIDVAQDRDSWRVVVNAVMKVQVTKKRGNFLTV